MPSRTFLPESKGKEISQRILMACMAWFLGLSNSLEPSQCFVCFRDSSPAWWMSLRLVLRLPQVRVHAAPCLFNGCLGRNSLTKLKGMETMGISCAMQIHILFTPNMLSSRSCDDYQKRYLKCEWVQSSDAIVTWAHLSSSLQGQVGL